MPEIKVKNDIQYDIGFVGTSFYKNMCGTFFLRGGKKNAFKGRRVA